MTDWPWSSKISFIHMCRYFWQWQTRIFIKNRTVYRFRKFFVKNVSVDSGFNNWNPGNCPVAEIPQRTSPTSHNTPFCSRMCYACIFMLHNGALGDICLMHWEIFEIGQFDLLYAITLRYIRAFAWHNRHLRINFWQKHKRLQGFRILSPNIGISCLVQKLISYWFIL